MTLVIVVAVKNINNVMEKGNYFVGLMSGTSLDGVDCVVYDFIKNKLIASSFTPYKDELKQKIKALAITPSLANIANLDIELCDIYSNCVLNLLTKYKISKTDIIAIGSHGQTIFHSPKLYSWQLGSGSMIAKKTKICTISDFRTADILAGGQGAPLTPKYHQYILNGDGTIVNLGGIANITIINNGKVIGFDTGPANTLIDNYMLKIKGVSFDKDGLFARSGVIINDLLAKMLRDDYFKLQAPKSTGVEYFNLKWLDEFLQGDENSQDIICTLTEFTAKTISKCLTNGKVYFCGGGVLNHFLMERLQCLNPDCKILTTNDLGVHPNFVEAVAFGYLAKLHIEKKSANLLSVGGAIKKVILGIKHNG